MSKGVKEHRKKREYFKKNKSERNAFIKNALEMGLF